MINNSITKKTETVFFNYLRDSADLSAFNIYDSTGQNEVKLPCIIVACNESQNDDEMPQEAGCRQADLTIMIETKARTQQQSRQQLDEIEGCIDQLMFDEPSILLYANKQLEEDDRIQQGYHVYDVNVLDTQEQFADKTFIKQLKYMIYCGEHDAF